MSGTPKDAGTTIDGIQWGDVGAMLRADEAARDVDEMKIAGLLMDRRRDLVRLLTLAELESLSVGDRRRLVGLLQKTRKKADAADLILIELLASAGAVVELRRRIRSRPAGRSLLWREIASERKRIGVETGISGSKIAAEQKLVKKRTALIAVIKARREAGRTVEAEERRLMRINAVLENQDRPRALREVDAEIDNLEANQTGDDAKANPYARRIAKLEGRIIGRSSVANFARKLRLDVGPDSKALRSCLGLMESLRRELQRIIPRLMTAAIDRYWETADLRPKIPSHKATEFDRNEEIRRCVVDLVNDLAKDFGDAPGARKAMKKLIALYIAPGEKEAARAAGISLDEYRRIELDTIFPEEDGVGESCANPGRAAQKYCERARLEAISNPDCDF